MSLIAKIFNFKSTVKYHQFMVEYTFYKEVIYLAYIQIFFRKKVKIIILPEHIGDVIAFTPFAQMLKTENKNAFIAWVIKPNFSTIIENNKYINYCISIFCDGVAQRFSKLKFFEIFDVRYNGNNFCPICQTERKFQKIDQNFTLDNYYEYGSLLEIFSKIAGKPMKKEDWYLNFTIPKVISDKIEKLNMPEKYICIHTTSNDSTREWENNKWRILIEKLSEKQNIRIVQIGLIDTLQITNDNYLNLCGKLSLIETAAVIKNSKLFVGIDSGPAHMANAFKVKSVILLGKYRNIKNYMPFSGNFANGINSEIIYNSEIKCSEIEVDEVFKHAIKLSL